MTMPNSNSYICFVQIDTDWADIEMLSVIAFRLYLKPNGILFYSLFDYIFVFMLGHDVSHID